MSRTGGVIRRALGNGESLVIGWSLAAVTFATGFISYTHISALVLAEHQNWKTAHLMPVVVDGQIAIGSGYFMANAGKRRRWFGLLGFAPGLIESLVANWMSGHPYGLFAALVATVPAQAFAVSSYLFERWLHERHPGAAPTVASVLAAAPLAMAKIAAQLLPQAPEPAAPGPEPSVTACRDTVRGLALSPRPEGAPWGLVSPAAAPVPEPSPAFAVPVLGPVMALSDRPAPRPRAVRAVADAGKLPLPRGEELVRVLSAMSRNEIWRTYQVSKHRADQLLKALAEGNLEEVA
jgi:hypothetical protein